ncbi:MAG TPA: hypothetical protein VKK79_14295 [Candidatus Lokiarchaeia archaeon]|nr:hypothetical protein [Candidatus Lokiarchaeia archaeon]
MARENLDGYTNTAVTRIKKGSIFQMVALVIHYVTGMYSTLYLTIPVVDPLSILFQWQSIELLLHIITGFLVLFCEIMMLYYSIKIHKRLFWILNSVNTVLVGLAIHAGAEFYLYGQNNFYSIWMAILYITVVLVDFAQYVLIRERLLGGFAHPVKNLNSSLIK